MYRKLLAQWLETDKAQKLARLDVGTTNMLTEFAFWLENNAAQQGAQRTGLDAYTWEELAKEIVRRGYEVALTPRR